MKVMLVAILALGTGSAFAQNLTKAQLSTLLQSKKTTLEAVHVGMTKSMVTTASMTLDDGTKCDYRQTAIQTILKFEGEKMIVLSKETFQPAVKAECQAAGVEAFSEDVIFFEAKPTLAQDLQDLNESDVKSISKAGEIITMTVAGTMTNTDGSTSSELLTVKYDLSKSSFRNLILSQYPSFKIETTDSVDVDVNTVNLTDVVFCESNDSQTDSCVRGDFSDILF